MGFLKGVDEDLPYAGNSSSDDKKMFRFYVGQNGKADISFLHGKSDLAHALEHDFSRSQNYRDRQQFVCLKALGLDCPLCKLPRDEQQVRSRYANYFLIIDHTPYTSKKGKTYVDTMKLLVMNKEDIKRLDMTVEGLKDKKLELAGARFTVRRPDSQRSSRVGESYSYEGHTDFSKFEATKDFDFSPKAIRAKLEEILLPNELQAKAAADWCLKYPMIKAAETVPAGPTTAIDDGEDSVPWTATPE